MSTPSIRWVRLKINDWDNNVRPARWSFVYFSSRNVIVSCQPVGLLWMFFEIRGRLRGMSNVTSNELLSWARNFGNGINPIYTQQNGHLFIDCFERTRQQNLKRCRILFSSLKAIVGRFGWRLSFQPLLFGHRPRFKNPNKTHVLKWTKGMHVLLTGIYNVAGETQMECGVNLCAFWEFLSKRKSMLLRLVYPMEK